ncbi:Uncharacterized protein OBRU01_10974, partial [Operophtera brumata]
MGRYTKCAKCGSSPSTRKDRYLTHHKFPTPQSNILRFKIYLTKFAIPTENNTSHLEDLYFSDRTKKYLAEFPKPRKNNNVTELTKTLRIEKGLTQQDEEASQVQDIPEKPKHMPNISQDSLDTCDDNISFESDQSNSEAGPPTTCDQPQACNPVNQSKKINKTIKKTDILKKVNELKPHEKKLYRICAQSLKEICRMRKQLQCKRKTDRLQYLCENEHIKKLQNMKLSNSIIVLLQSQLQNCKKPLKARQYSSDQKITACTLYKRSPALYRLLRRMFTIPCQSTLNKLLNSMPLTTGINPQVFNALKSMAEKQLDEENICILSFDEMAIRKHLMYNEKLDIIEGYQDHGNHGRSKEITCKALVFMLTGVQKKWKQPIAFYFSGKLVSAERLHVIIKEGHEIVTILDPPHLLKRTRNLFLKYDVECTANIDGKDVKGVAKWSHVQQFHDMDKTNPNHVFAPKLTKQHLNPNSRQKNRVKLATQVFSHTVTSGILAKIATNELPAEAHATATLLSKFDQLFDALNADSTDLRRWNCSKNMTKRTAHMNVFLKMAKFVLDIKFIGLNSPPPSQMGWMRTMIAVERLWGNLKVTSLSIRRLNLDPLQNCFACIRYHCGSNVNPNISQFINGLKTAILNNLRDRGAKPNCEDDGAILSDDLKKLLLSTTTPENICENWNIDLEHVIADATEAVDQATPDVQAYVCGNIYEKFKRRACTVCKKVFLASSTTLDTKRLFNSFREYEDMQNSLNYVNRHFMHVAETCDSAMDEVRAFLNNPCPSKTDLIKLRGPLTGGVYISKHDVLEELDRKAEHRHSVVPSGTDYAREIRQRETDMYQRRQVERKEFESMSEGLESLEQLTSFGESTLNIGELNEEAMTAVYSKYTFTRKEETTNKLAINFYKQKVFSKLEASSYDGHAHRAPRGGVQEVTRAGAAITPT